MIGYNLLTSMFILAADPLASTNSPQPQKRESIWQANAEMAAIFKADQEARENPDKIDWEVVGREDEQRRTRTQELLTTGALNSGDDFYHAAFVFQHGSTPEDYLKAHVLATAAVAKGKAEATWIAAATLDRYLQAIGKPQVLGTQYKKDSDGGATQEPFSRALLPDTLRTVLGVPVLSKQEERRKALAESFGGRAVTMAVPKLKVVPASPVARSFKANLRPIACRSVPGAEQVLDRPNLRWLVLGEMHGTTESPEGFSDMVCLSSRSRPVTVAVEQPTSEQASIDAFIGSDGGQEARSRFLQSSIWKEPVKDGRSSEAQFRLFQRLRELRAAGQVSRVVAFAPLYEPGPAAFDPGDYENTMAGTLISRAGSDGLTLVLVGNLHAQRTAVAWATPPYLPMAGYLPQDRTITLDVRWNGGSYWACTLSTECGPQTVAPSSVPTARGIILDSPSIRPYSGAFYLGMAATASSPQKELQR